MNDNPKNNGNSNGASHTSHDPNANLHLAFDVGHSSIGWAVLDAPADAEVLGCGSVIFRADDCLASDRRAFRRQRRHIRSTRQRIARLKVLLRHLGVLTEAELNVPGCAWPWMLAARVLRGGKALSWTELWDVLRWYAHNRGYDGNRRWSRVESENAVDTEKVQNANALMEEHGTESMAETICAVSGIDPLGKKRSAAVAPKDRFKSQNAAFDRDVVRGEMQRVLEAHAGQLDKLDADVIRCLIGNDPWDDAAWQVVPVPGLKLPKRYFGSLLFGQLVPRFDNRIISTCPISGGKVPTRHAPEFLAFRWAMQLANVRVAGAGEKELRPLTAPERKQVDEAMHAEGFLTKGNFKKAVREIIGSDRDNLDTMLLHPDAERALVLDPVRKFAHGGILGTLFLTLPENIRRLALNSWRRGKRQTLADLLALAEKHGSDTGDFETALEDYLANPPKSRGKKKAPPPTRESVLNKNHFYPRGAPGRGPYTRTVMAQAAAEAMAGGDPREEGGCLYVTDELRHAQLNRPLAEQTNNHLVRHRLLMLGRVLEDVVAEYADGDKSKIARAVIEVNRDVRELSGKSAKQVAQDLGLRLANHKSVSKKLEEEMAALGKPITASLIRKARVADDLDWTCPFTGKRFDVPQLVHGAVDREHIIPRSLRPTDALDALVMTFSAVNHMKGKRTALQFIEEEGGNAVQGAPHLTLFTPTQYKKFVDKLETFKGHDDDKKRKKRRKDWLLLADYEEKEFTPGDLTQTSQIVRLGAQVIQRHFQECEKPPRVISLPGSVTGEVRKAWRLTGTLAVANPQVLNEDGSTKTKTEIRGITHLHHALDACVLGLAAHFIPNNGRVWQLIVKRRLNPAEQNELLKLGVYSRDADGRVHLRDLADHRKEQITHRLAERRVVQHLPARMTGLRVEQNTWRVEQVEDGVATLSQRIRGEDGTLPATKQTTEKTIKLLGPDPVPGSEGKLAALKGALVIPENFGAAILDNAKEGKPLFEIVPFHKVWPRLQKIKERNGNKFPRVIRNGQIIKITGHQKSGLWMVRSVKHSLKLDLTKPDVIKVASSGYGIWREVSLVTLGPGKIELMQPSFAGVVAENDGK